MLWSQQVECHARDVESSLIIFFQSTILARKTKIYAEESSSLSYTAANLVPSY